MCAGCGASAPSLRGADDVGRAAADQCIDFPERSPFEAVARAYEVEIGACEDMVSRVSLWCDSTGLVGAQGRCRAAYGLTPCSPAAKSTHYLEHTPYKSPAPL